MLHRTHHDAAFDTRYNLKLENFFPQESVKRRDVAGRYPKFIVRTTRYQRTLHDFRPAHNSVLECFQIAFRWKRQLDGAINFTTQAQFFTIEQTYAASDEAIFFQAFDAPPAWRARQADLFCDCGKSRCRIILNDIQNSVVRSG